MEELRVRISNSISDETLKHTAGMKGIINGSNTKSNGEVVVHVTLDNGEHYYYNIDDVMLDYLYDIFSDIIFGDYGSLGEDECCDKPKYLYELFEYYSHEENEDDVFVISNGSEICMGDVYYIEVDGKCITEYYTSLDMINIEISYSHKKVASKDMTIDEIEELLGFEINIVD